jgi:predicted RNA-binding Zn-ribbon protein involved in translation (DUF1610 family)
MMLPITAGVIGGTVAKRTTATSWGEVVAPDDTAALIDLNYTCPHCHYATGQLIMIGAGNDLDGAWETDQVCPVCGEDVVVEVLPSARS